MRGSIGAEAILKTRAIPQSGRTLARVTVPNAGCRSMPRRAALMEHGTLIVGSVGQTKTMPNSASAQIVVRAA